MKLLFVAALLLLAAGSACSGSDPKFDPAKFVGTYEGNWLSPGLTGPGQVIIAVDEVRKTATITLDLGGNYLGQGDPAPTTMSGTYDEKQATAKGKDPYYGDYLVTIDGNGKIQGTLIDAANGAVPKMTFTGKLTEKRMDVDYVVHFTNGGETKSKVSMAKK